MLRIISILLLNTYKNVVWNSVHCLPNLLWIVIDFSITSKTVGIHIQYNSN